MAHPKLIAPKIAWLEQLAAESPLWPKNVRSQKTVGKFLLLLFVSVAIGSLLSPRFTLQTSLYEEGDVIRENVVIPENMLLPDRVSTKLKGDKLIKDLGTVYDYDPNLFASSISRIQKAFALARAEQVQIKQAEQSNAKKRHDLGGEYFRLLQSLQDTDHKINQYKSFKAFLSLQLQGLPEKLSAKDFIVKSKLDADLQITSRLVKELGEKKKRDQETLTRYPTLFSSGAAELTAAEAQVKERKGANDLNLLKALGLELTEVERSAMNFDYTEPSFERTLLDLLSGVQNSQIIGSKEELAGGQDKLVLRNLLSGGDEPYQSPDQFTSLDDARDKVRQFAQDRFTQDESGRQRSLGILLAQKLLRPTVTLNKLELEKRKEGIVETMSPVYFSVKKGEVIARAGDRATRHQVELIQSFYDEMENAEKWPKMLGTLLIVLFSLVLVYFVLQLKGGARLSFKSLLLMSLAIVLTLFLVKGLVVVGESISMRYTEMDTVMLRYLFPVALTSMLVGILINFEVALLAGLLTSLFLTLMVQGNLYFFFFAMVGSMIASLPMTKFESRHSLLNHGLKVSVLNLPVILIVLLIERNELGPWVIPYFVAGALGGVLSAVLASVLLPLFEALFDVTTNLRLLELSNMNHPALKHLIFNAPGTYQHSILVGNLTEAAAQKIGANPLLARVGSYYHDLGKGQDSHFFIENQPQNSTNIHDEIDDPYVSAKKIIDHLRIGALMAEKFRLGSLIRDMIVQHHGIGLVRYFYDRAIKNAMVQDENVKLDESPFRYPGPKPQSLEAALIMLADASEASTRSIEKPTEALIGQMVQKVGWAILKDGQLDESGMTLEQFRDTLQCFVKVLVSIHHHRIQYPDEVGLVSNRHKAAYNA